MHERAERVAIHLLHQISDEAKQIDRALRQRLRAPTSSIKCRQRR